MPEFQIAVWDKALTAGGLSESSRKAEMQAQFGKEIDQTDLVSMASSGLQAAAHRASNCLGWIWRQWLLGESRAKITDKVVPFVKRGLELRRLARSYHFIPVHDLFLLHAAIFACDDGLLDEVAGKIADAEGDKLGHPMDNGELYTAAWCGMIKHWLLGDDAKARRYAQVVWEAHREKHLLVAPKTLVLPWIKKDWKTFVSAQCKDFQKLWLRADKDQWTIKSESSTEVVVTTDRYQIGHQWC